MSVHCVQVKASQSKVYSKKAPAVDLTLASKAHASQADDIFEVTHTHTIKSAAQRVQEAAQKSEQISKLKQTAKAVNSGVPLHMLAPVGGIVHIKVRVNGKLESTHKIGVEDKFAKLAGMVNAQYKLPESTKLSMEADGEGLGMGKTPADFDMEEGEDYLVDIKVDAKTFEQMKASRG